MKRIILVLILSTAFLSNQAQERLFTYTYQSHVLEKGAQEVEVWNTLRLGKADSYRGLDSRLEWEIGLGNHLETALFINATTAAERTGDLMVNTGSSLSVSSEWKWKLSDPEKNRLGSALYEEIALGRDGLEFETKLLLDKKVGSSTHAINLVHELGFLKELSDGELEKQAENKFEIDYGFSRNVNKHFDIGFELREDNLLHKGAIEYSSLFAGPAIHYTSHHFWLNFSLMPQLYSFKGNTSRNLNLVQHEKVETRLIFSFEL